MWYDAEEGTEVKEEEKKNCLTGTNGSCIVARA